MRRKRDWKKIHPLPPQPQNCSWQPGPDRSLEAGKGISTRMTEISPNLLRLAELVNIHFYQKCVFCAYYLKYWGSSLKTFYSVLHPPYKKKRKKKILKGKRKEKQMGKINPISALGLISKPFPLEKHGKRTFYWKEISWDSRHSHRLRC